MSVPSRFSTGPGVSMWKNDIAVIIIFVNLQLDLCLFWMLGKTYLYFSGSKNYY